MAVRGIHNDVLSTELIDGGFVSIGWDRIGDLREVGIDRERLKAALSEAYPDDKPRAIAGWAGNLLRFSSETQLGDLVVAPNRSDSTINLGVVTGDYAFQADAQTHRHRRTVRWERLGVSRTSFSQPALYEIGSLLAVFGVRKHPDEFLEALTSTPNADRPAKRSMPPQLETSIEEAAVDEPRATRVERHTRDFVLERLKVDLSPEDFEWFTADLLRAMGYEARVTSSPKTAALTSSPIRTR